MAKARKRSTAKKKTGGAYHSGARGYAAGMSAAKKKAAYHGGGRGYASGYAAYKARGGASAATSDCLNKTTGKLKKGCKFVKGGKVVRVTGANSSKRKASSGGKHDPSCLRKSGPRRGRLKKGCKYVGGRATRVK